MMRPYTSWMAVALLTVACTAQVPGGVSSAVTSGRTTFALSFRNLLAIDPQVGHYEAWALTNAGAKSLGAFVVGASGTPLALDGTPLATWSVPVASAAISQLFVTQELASGSNGVPSKQVFLQGALKGTQADLAAPLLAADVANKSGAYLLDNPATDKDPTDWNGIWFARIDQGRYQPGLTLDPSPDGWMYAGWVIYRGIVLRTGKFRDPMSNDDWYGYSGLTSVSLPVNFPGPPLPGEDFNTNLPPGVPSGHNLPDLAGSRVVISLENAALANEEQYPSPIHLFEATVPTPSAQKVTYPLTNVASTSIPSGTATIL